MSGRSSTASKWWSRVPMTLAAACFIGMLVAAVAHARAAATALLVLFVVFFLAGWLILFVGVLRLKKDASRLVRERKQTPSQDVWDSQA